MDPLQQRANEKKVYEEVVNIIVDFVSNEFGNDEQARLRIYSRIVESFEGMVRVLSRPNPDELSLIDSIEYADGSEDESE